MRSFMCSQFGEQTELVVGLEMYYDGFTINLRDLYCLIISDF